jgi:hypothetical protein
MGMGMRFDESWEASAGNVDFSGRIAMSVLIEVGVYLALRSLVCVLVGSPILS